MKHLCGVAVAAALAFPGAALAHPPAGGEHGRAGLQHGDSAQPNGNTAQPNGATAQPNGDTAQPNGDTAQPNGDTAQPNGQGQAHRHAPIVALVARATVMSVDPAAKTAVLHVTHADHHGHALVGTDVTVDLSTADISVADVNGDSATNLADVGTGDVVDFQARVALRGPVGGPVKVRKLVDRSHRRPHGHDRPGPAAPAPTA